MNLISLEGTADRFLSSGCSEWVDASFGFKSVRWSTSALGSPTGKVAEFGTGGLW
ncbi:hypothetical protein MPER_02647, partial [Moniliophthora perniciosa FA553]